MTEIIAVPSYNREDKVLRLLNFYKNQNVVLCFCFQKYSDKAIYKFEKSAEKNKVILKYTKFDDGIKVGNARIEALKTLVKYVEDNNIKNPECFMHDDDIIFEEIDRKALSKLSKIDNNRSLFGYDFFNKCDSKLSEETRLVFWFVHMKLDLIKFLIKKLTKDIGYFEDIELVHLACCFDNKRPIVFSEKLFSKSYNFENYLEESTIQNRAKQKEEALKKLQSRYGYENIKILFIEDELRRNGSSIYPEFKRNILPN